MGMTVQELIDELMKVEDKSAIVNVIKGDADNETMILFMKLMISNGTVITL